jgi:hypothetical protein
MLGAVVQHSQSLPALMAVRLDEDFIARLGDVDRCQHGVIKDRLDFGHGRSLRNEDSNTVILEMHRLAMAALPHRPGSHKEMLRRRVGQFVHRSQPEACANFFAHAGYAT